MTRPSIERTAEKAFMLSDRIKLSSAEAHVEGIVGGSVGVGEGILTGFHAHSAHTEPKSAFMRLMISRS